MPTIWRSGSTTSTACACGSAPCRNIRPNALNYNLTWSTDGLINEYIEQCEAIVEGEADQRSGDGGAREFSLDGVTYEAFNTSGGLGTLAETLQSRVRTMNYRTIRYPGHQAIIEPRLTIST